MKKVVFSLLLVFSVAAITSCQKTETNTESSTKNKILGTWYITSSTLNYYPAKVGAVWMFGDNGEWIIRWSDGKYFIYDNNLALYCQGDGFNLEIVKLNDTKMVLSGKYFSFDSDGDGMTPVDIELERVVK